MMPPAKETPAEQPKKAIYEIKKRDLVWGIVLYGIIMWAAGFIWAGMVL